MDSRSHCRGGQEIIFCRYLVEFGRTNHSHSSGSLLHGQVECPIASRIVIGIEITINFKHDDVYSFTYSDRIAFLLQRRLKYQADLVQCKRWHQAMAMDLSNNPLETMQQFKDLIQIVIANAVAVSANANANSANSNSANDLSVSQVALGAIYVATGFHMLADTSPNFQDTWTFLRRRVQEWLTTTTTMTMAAVPSLFNNNNNSTAQLTSTVATFASGIFSMVQMQIPWNNKQLLSFSAAATSTTPTATPPPITAAAAAAVDGTHPSHYQQQ